MANNRAGGRTPDRARNASDRARAEAPAGADGRRSRPPGRRSRAESERTRGRILDRAERLFARKGYRGASLRELARACGVHPFTIQNHFGSKLSLYRAVLCRWDVDITDRVVAAAEGAPELGTVVERVVDDLFDFFLARRDWVALNARHALGEGLPRGIAPEGGSWLRFVEAQLRERRVGPLPLDPGLLLITIEGMLNNHVLGSEQYRQLFGRDVTDSPLRERTKSHLKQVLLALLAAPSPSPSPPDRRPVPARRGAPA